MIVNLISALITLLQIVTELRVADARLIAVRSPDPREGLSCPPENGAFNHPKFCDKYLNCWNGEVVVVGQCPNGLVFNEKIGACDYPRNVDCGGRPVSTPTSSGNSNCPRPDGTFASPSNCSQFIVCQGGNATVYSCPDDLHYSNELGVCMYKKDAGCQQMETPDGSSQGSNQSSPSTTTTPTLNPMESSSQSPIVSPGQQQPSTQSPTSKPPAATTAVPILTPGSPTIDPGSVHEPPGAPTVSTTTTTTPRPSDIDQVIWPAWPNWPTAKCPIIQGMLPVLGDCEAVVVCLGGVGHFFRCPQGHAFDVNIGKCGPIRVTEGCQHHLLPEGEGNKKTGNNKITMFMMNPFASQIKYVYLPLNMALMHQRIHNLNLSK